MVKQHLNELRKELNRLPRRWSWKRGERKSNVPAFNLFSWVTRRDAIGRSIVGDTSGPRSCGTVACAAGLAATLPYFNRRGFKLSGRIGGDPQPIYVTRKGVRYGAWSAVSNFFGLSYQETRYLFSTTEYDNSDWGNPKAVADRIKKFIKHGGIAA